MIWFKERSAEEEQMDDLHLGRDRIKAVLEDINVVNSLLGGNRITLRALNKLLATHPRAEYSILDVGCGDGALLREVAVFCRKNHVKASLVGIDLNANSIELAKQRHGDMENITFVQGDVFSLDPGEHNCDVLLCTLTLHHFRDEDIAKFVKKFAALTQIGVIINDLDRNRIAYALFRVFSALFMKTSIAKQDGLISIKRGFTKKDLLSYAGILPDMVHKISWRWAFRYEWSFWHPNRNLQ